MTTSTDASGLECQDSPVGPELRGTVSPPEATEKPLPSTDVLVVEGEQTTTAAAEGGISMKTSFRAKARHTAKTWIGTMILVGCATLLLSWVAGAFMAGVRMNEGDAKHLTACELELIGARPGLSDKPWELEHPQWFLGVIFTGTFFLRKYVFSAVADYAYRHLSHDKRQKTANYMLEVIATTAVLLVSALAGYWDLVFKPANYEPANSVSTDQLYSFSWSMNASFCCFLAAYIMEMAFDEHMRFTLLVHHWLTLFLSFWAWWVLGILGGDLMVLRIVFAFQLHMSTEGVVFAALLLYQAKVTKACIFTFVAWYYSLSRLLITIVSLWTWWEGRESIFQKHDHNSITVYSLFVFVPFANLILNATQFSTVLNLFGIAKKVKASADQLKTTRRLVRMFDYIDFDQAGAVTRDTWMRHVSDTLKDMGLPRWGIAATFDEMDTRKTGEVSFDQFANHFGPFLLDKASDQTTLMVAILVGMLEKGCLRKLERDLYLSYIDKALAYSRLPYSPSQFSLSPRSGNSSPSLSLSPRSGIKQSAASTVGGALEARIERFRSQEHSEDM